MALIVSALFWGEIITIASPPLVPPSMKGNPNVTDRSQLKWVFDGKKVSQEELSIEMKKIIEEWNVPKEITDIWITDNYSLLQLKKDLLNIFVAK